MDPTTAISLTSLCWDLDAQSASNSILSLRSTFKARCCLQKQCCPNLSSPEPKFMPFLISFSLIPKGDTGICWRMLYFDCTCMDLANRYMHMVHRIPLKLKQSYFQGFRILSVQNRLVFPFITSVCVVRHWRRRWYMHDGQFIPLQHDSLRLQWRSQISLGDRSKKNANMILRDSVNKISSSFTRKGNFLITIAWEHERWISDIINNITTLENHFVSWMKAYANKVAEFNDLYYIKQKL